MKSEEERDKDNKKLVEERYIEQKILSAVESAHIKFILENKVEYYNAVRDGISKGITTWLNYNKDAIIKEIREEVSKKV